MLDVGLAHSRFEVLDQAGLPSVEIWVGGKTKFVPWSDFVLATRPGIASQRAKARSVGYFIDFIAARGLAYQPENERYKLFPDFADALRFGTVAAGTDDTGLWWLPKRVALAQRIVREVTEFTDWLADTAQTKPLNPLRGATLAQEMTYWRAWARRTQNSLLKHLKQPERAQKNAFMARAGVVRGKPPKSTDLVKAFPEDAFWPLISDGFARAPHLRWTVLRDVCIALLLHGGGLRLSEALHMWLIDVFDDPHHPSGSIVRIFHPSEGIIEATNPETGRSIRMSRESYLSHRYGIRPLHHQTKNRAVGWKEPALDNSEENYLQVYWRDPIYSSLFRDCYSKYMECRPLVKSHPYAFIVSSNELRPMTVKAYEKVHATAVRRIGLIPAKHLGTTPHGHRHATGKYLAASNLPRKVIMKILHHASEASQDVYTEPTIAEVQSSLREYDALLRVVPIDTEVRFGTRG
nr:gamma-mobile-trio recombinase GmtY [uncultured Sphingomonas sp.]